MIRTLTGDLDWITLRATEKDRDRRYASASEMAEDIRHFLNDEPVSACPPSSWYRFKKMILRHRWAVSLSAVGLLFLILFGASMAIQAHRIATERDRAEMERERAVRFSNLLVGLFNNTNPSMGGTTSVEELLRLGVWQIDSGVHDNPRPAWLWSRAKPLDCLLPEGSRRITLWYS